MSQTRDFSNITLPGFGPIPAQAVTHGGKFHADDVFSTVKQPSRRVSIRRPTRLEGRPTARPSAAVSPSRPMSLTQTAS